MDAGSHQQASYGYDRSQGRHPRSQHSSLAMAAFTSLPSAAYGLAPAPYGLDPTGRVPTPQSYHHASTDTYVWPPPGNVYAPSERFAPVEPCDAVGQPFELPSDCQTNPAPFVRTSGAFAPYAGAPQLASPPLGRTQSLPLLQTLDFSNLQYRTDPPLFTPDISTSQSLEVDGFDFGFGTAWSDQDDFTSSVNSGTQSPLIDPAQLANLGSVTETLEDPASLQVGQPPTAFLSAPHSPVLRLDAAPDSPVSGGPKRTARPSRRTGGPSASPRRRAAAATADDRLPPSAPQPAVASSSQATGPMTITEHGRRDSRKTTIETSLLCSTCDRQFAKLVLRGSSDEMAGVQFAAMFECSTCAGHAPVKRPANELAAIRRRQAFVEGVVPPQDVSVCEVCTRTVGHGHVYIPATDSTPANSCPFAAEILCTSCWASYRRCSDCGGGTTGKWRCEQLFGAGRKTCSLDHTRAQHTAEMTVSIGHAASLRRELLDRCEALLRNSVLANLAIPEFLESDATPWMSTFQDVEPFADRAWHALEPSFYTDIESQQQIRRYVALRWTRPRPRKARLSDTLDDIEVENAQQTSGGSVSLSPWTREGRTISGWSLFEYEKRSGSVYMPAVVPWTTAEPFDASTLMLTEAIKRVQEDRSRELQRREAMGDDRTVLEALLPPLRYVWTEVFYPPTHRLVSYMVKKRGFKLLDDFLAAYPDVSRQAFPPHRASVRPLDQQTGWLVLVKRLDGATAANASATSTSKGSPKRGSPTSKNPSTATKKSPPRARRTKSASSAAEIVFARP